MKNLLSLLLLALVASCNNVNDSIPQKTVKKCSQTYKEYDAYFTLDDSIVFNLGRHFNMSSYSMEEIGNTDYFTIADYHTKKEIQLHNVSTKEVFKIPLNYILNEGEKIQAYEVINLDTIVVSTNYSSQLYFLDRKGVPWKKIDFREHLKKFGTYELRRGNTPFMFDDTTAIFPLEYRSKNDEERNNIKEAYRARYAAPLLFKVDNIFSDSLKCEVGLDSLYYNFTDADHEAVEGLFFTYFPQQIVFFSSFSDSLYLINPMTLKLENKVQVLSEFTPIGIEPPLSGSYASGATPNWGNRGFIDDVLYDSQKERYFVKIRHVKKEKDRFPWSIIITDENFRKIKEIEVDDYQYSSTSFIVDGKLMILDNSISERNARGVRSWPFKLFTYE